MAPFAEFTVRRLIRPLLFVSLMLTWVCGAHSAQADGVLRRGMGHEPETLDPHRLSSGLAFNIALDMFEGLTAFKADGSLEPAVAQSWTASADGRTWTFKLRRDLKWSDGTPITAEDVVFSFRRFVDPKTAAPYVSAAHLIANARAVNSGTLPIDKLGVASPDADTIVLSLEHPAPFLPRLLARANMVVVPKAAVLKFGDQWLRPENLVSNGAFVLKERVPNSHITLARNPLYRAPAIVDQLIYEPTTDLEAAVTKFRAGGLDLQYNFPVARTATLKKEMPAETKEAQADPVPVYLPLNIHNPKLKDVRVRRALSLATDREHLVRRVLQTDHIPMNGFIPRGIGDYQPPEIPGFSEPMAARLKKAKALFAEAGISTGSPLKLVYSFNAANSDSKRIGIALAEMWKPLGIALELEGTDSKVMFANMAKGNFDISYYGFRPEYPDPISYLNSQLTDGNINHSKYSNAAYDALVAQAAQTVEPAARQALFHKAELMMLSDQPIIPLYAGSLAPYLVSQRLRGWQANAERIHLSRYMSVAR